MKIYIVGKVTGEDFWEDKFEKMTKIIMDEYSVDQALLSGEKNSYWESLVIKTPMQYPKGLTQKEYMVLSCESVLWADQIIVCTTADWQTNKGTKAEIALAESYGLPISFRALKPFDCIPSFQDVKINCYQTEFVRTEKNLKTLKKPVFHHGPKNKYYGM